MTMVNGDYVFAVSLYIVLDLYAALKQSKLVKLGWFACTPIIFSSNLQVFAICTEFYGEVNCSVLKEYHRATLHEARLNSLPIRGCNILERIHIAIC